ncbi:EF-hand calcium-binding domain-containing protein 7 [Saguinus oedipus]|uniref:EF-hand calcium-binding domain-containing protein 7 n=1 Tax=Saguinus oedipus TaxID=9490 RepID=A0ABQ9VDI9_SAGOE|nr:EF-hand calcium-binding domain-containing protein 7 [Saguinus oedipus]
MRDFKVLMFPLNNKKMYCLSNFDTKKNELTRQGFMDLNLMEANDREGDPCDLWVTLHSMGYNKALELTEIEKLGKFTFFFKACPFVINTYAEKCKPKIKAVHMEACSGQLEKAICKSVLSKGDAKVMDGYENIIVHTYSCDTWITSVVENKSDEKVIIHINNELSKNCVNNRGLNIFAVEVAPNSTMSSFAQVDHVIFKDISEYVTFPKNPFLITLPTNYFDGTDT